MNVCIVAYTFYEGDNRVRRCAETLEKRGDSVDVVVLQNVDGPKNDIVNGVNIHRIQKRVINEKSKWSYFYRLNLFLIRSFIFITINHLRKGYKLIHVHSVPDYEVFAALIPKLTGVKVILDIHDIVPEFYASKFGVHKSSLIFKSLIIIEKISIAFSDHIIIANHLWEQTLINRGVKTSKITTIINYPELSIFSKNLRNKKNSRFILMYPGSLHWHQGVDLALNAFAGIVNDFQEAEFHIYGDGPEKSSLEAKVAELGLNKRVLFKGLLPREEMAKKMANADLGVVPKRSDSFGNEAFSTKTMEFMALGVPVLISETAVDRYYFNDDIAMFFRPGDVDDLAEKMTLIINDEPLRKKLVKHAYRFAQNNNWDEKKYIYLDILARLAMYKEKP